ncbi:MAG: hypothetical protein HUN05_14805 [Desulfobacter sp.]|nr:MAG: hypothetical protein HUN05_14805 [Desulfobacter sp.]
MIIDKNYHLTYIKQMDIKAHGSFAFKFEPDYTLISAAESWNLECVEIYTRLLKQRVESKPQTRRCIILDGRNWDFLTPECHQKFIELNQYISGYYQELFIGYSLSSENFHFSKYILDIANNKFKESIHWRFFKDLQDLTSWLNSNAFKIPNLKDGDFPELVPASHYLKYL